MAIRFYDLDEAATLLKITPGKLEVMRKNGEIHGFRDGSNWIFKADEVQQLLDQQSSDDDSSELRFQEVTDDDAMMLGEPPDLAAVLGTDDDDLSDSEDFANLPEDDEFLLSPSGEVLLSPSDDFLLSSSDEGFADSSDSGSQVIALSDSQAFDDDLSDSEDFANLQDDDEFLLSPSDDRFGDDSSDSGSQVIALSDSQAFDEDAATMLADLMFEEDPLDDGMLWTEEARDALADDLGLEDAYGPTCRPRAKTVGVWGIDIGQCALKALHCTLDGDQVIADAFDYIEYPKMLTQPEASAEELIQKALEEFLSRHNLTGNLVAISVPGQSGLAKFFKPPPVEPKKLPALVQFEARQQIPFDLDEVIWDYQQMGWQSDSDTASLETEVGLFAIKRDQLLNHIQPFDDADIELDIIQLSPVAVYNFVAYDLLNNGDNLEEYDPENPPESIVILAMGTETTDLVITNGHRVWQRSIPLGGNHFTRQLTKELKLTFAKAEHLKRNVREAKDVKVIFQSMRPVFNDLVTEVQRSIGYFQGIDRKATIRSVIAMGNAVKLPGLCQYLSNNLGYEVEDFSSFARLGESSVTNSPVFKDNVLSFGVCYGLCLQGLGEAPLQTNFAPRKPMIRRLTRLVFRTGRFVAKFFTASWKGISSLMWKSRAVSDGSESSIANGDDNRLDELSDDDSALSDDELVLSPLDSEINLGDPANSRTNLGNPSDRDISLDEEPLNLAGGSSSALELPVAQRRFSNGNGFQIVVGDIVELAKTSEVIVSADDSLLRMARGIANRIKQAAGSQVREAAQQFAPVQVGRVIATPAGNLPQRMIFHAITLAVPVSATKGNYMSTPDLIGNILDSCCYHIESLQVKSIIFPLLAYGIAEMEPERCLKTMVNYLVRELDEGTTPLQEATIVIHPSDFDELASSIEELL